MMHYFIGDLGHLFVITTFITSLVAAFSYVTATGIDDLEKKSQWLNNGRTAFYVHVFAVIGICVTLFIIIANHYFEYFYPYDHSDRKLPAYYLISTFWNGQEGSFLLWMFWQAILGVIIINTNKFWEAPVMTVFALVQAFLTSMILGVVIPGIEFKIGSSPFILLRDAMRDAPIFTMQPDFIPKDGNGLNPLLQNYWMVIHPPTLFLGFACTLVPFAYCMAGLWLKKYRDWIRPALPWALFGCAILGLGILMGGYWAYETLNFGGYWNWDPVENAVYVPWLVMVASLHTMIAYKNSETALKASMILVISVFILILYSTFLTRSGVLGDASVHSFTDLGLNGQLLVYLGFFALAAIALLAARWKAIPTSQQEASVYSREFWIFIGIAVLCCMGFQVLLATSIPVFNKLGSWMGLNTNLALPADQIAFYSKFQIWFAVGVAILSGVGQFFWWKKITWEQLWKELQTPLLLTLIIWAVVITVGQVYKIPYMVVVLASLFTITLNGKILLGLIKSSPTLSGGAIAHIGIGMVLLGILFSAGYSKIVSLNNTGLQISNEQSKEFNRDNLLLFVNEPRTMAGYDIEYLGERLEPRHGAGYIDRAAVLPTGNKDEVIAKHDIALGGKTIPAKDTIEIKGENTYYEIELRQGEKKYTLFPRAQINPNMGGLLASPDIHRTMGSDIYTHVSSVMSPEQEPNWSEVVEQEVPLQKEFFANDYVTTIEKVERVDTVDGIELTGKDVAVKATIKVKGERKEYTAEPIFLIKDNMVGRIPDEIRDLGIRLSIMNIHPTTNTFSVGISTRQKDWVVIKALEKPLINVLWIGTLVLMIGFGIAMTRRVREFRLMREKGLE